MQNTNLTKILPTVIAMIVPGGLWAETCEWTLYCDCALNQVLDQKITITYDTELNRGLLSGLDIAFLEEGYANQVNGLGEQVEFSRVLTEGGSASVEDCEGAFPEESVAQWLHKNEGASEGDDVKALFFHERESDLGAALLFGYTTVVGNEHVENACYWESAGE